jgi:hypothetical protein
MNNGKKKAKTEQLGPDSVPELNTKNLDDSLIFPSVTQTTPFSQWFRRYRILNIDLAADSYF